MKCAILLWYFYG